ncbi:MAG: type II toxin-antitoxin system HigB family toxin [Alphaproteobacteria bacterium]|nr:type II toxin-antitoxin system HigB family toxin [Alphaproteobacteria bacterium]
MSNTTSGPPGLGRGCVKFEQGRRVHLITEVDFAAQRMPVAHVSTHAEYDRIDALAIDAWRSMPAGRCLRIECPG